ncbi:MAG: glutaredoxin 3 [Bdellovibrionales bacterium]
MAKVIMYTKDWCPYCKHAKTLLDGKGVEYVEENLENDPDKMAEIIKQTGMRTVPQIFINDKLIGGFSELSALESEGKLDGLLDS